MSKSLEEIISELGRTDIYLIDQMMKGRYHPMDSILDAGCGHGRNIELFIKSGITVFGVDVDIEKIQYCKRLFPQIADHFQVQDLISLSFEDNTFDHIISSAVFHFAESTDHFNKMFSEHVRVLKRGGTIFIRMTSLFGLPADTAVSLSSGIYRLPDYGDRFLMTHSLIQKIKTDFNLSTLDPIKTVNVHDNRAMAVIVFQKN